MIHRCCVVMAQDGTVRITFDTLVNGLSSLYSLLHTPFLYLCSVLVHVFPQMPASPRGFRHPTSRPSRSTDTVWWSRGLMLQY